MSRYRTFRLALLLVLVAPSSLATLPRRDLCYDVLCVSVVEGAPNAVADRTYQQSSTGRRFLQTRFANGDSLTLLLRPEGSCQVASDQTIAKIITQSAKMISGRGCLAAPNAGRFFKVDFTLSSPNGLASQRLRLLEPSVRISRITNAKYTYGPTYDSNTLWLEPGPTEP